MKKYGFLIACALLLAYSIAFAWVGPIMVGGGAVVSGAATPGQDFSDAFPYDNGELSSVSSGAWVKLTGTDSSISGGELIIQPSTVYIYDAQTSTISQYVAVEYRPSSVTSYTGVYARQVASDNATTVAYCLRNNNGSAIAVRYCTGASCSDIASFSVSIAEGDSLGLEVTGTGLSTKWKVWHWSSSAPPAYASWGTCDYGVYVTGESATTCTTTNSSGNVNGDGDGSTNEVGQDFADSGKYLGIYSGGNAQYHDNWVGGDAD